jgi:uncharacterized protein
MRLVPLWVLLAPMLLGCGEDERLIQNGLGAGGSAGTSSSASFFVRASVEQVFVTHAKPGIALSLLDSSDAEVQTGDADSLGSIVFRHVTSGSGYRVRSTPDDESGPVRVMSTEGSLPDPSFYSDQKIQAGFGYITMRDGVTLAAYVTLPGPAEEGPYPTVVNYSGYDPAKPGEPLGNYEALCGILPTLCDAPNDPSALIAALMGYATVGVNMRGTGCSGGAYDFFEPLQLMDGYDVIETVAAQPWVLGHRVGMTGLSYPGITQLFVAKTHPPSLASITPLSVIGNTISTALPGGILNDGFAVEWANEVTDKAAPYGQGWEQDRVDAGDDVCKENQLLHDQRVDMMQKAYANPYYTDDVAKPVDPSAFVDQIDVPVFLACAWQDEQTGPFCFNLFDHFTSSPLVRVTAQNGVHPDAFAPAVLSEWKAFLDLTVQKTVPNINGLVRTMAPQLFNEIFKAELDLPPDRFAKFTSYEDALAAYQKEPPVRVIFESGAADPLGAPADPFEAKFQSWPPPTEPRRFYFEPDGSLGDAAPSGASSAFRFTLDPGAGERGILAPGGDVWDLLPDYDWKPLESGKAVAFVSAPLAQDLLMVGPGSVDLWVRSDVDDADLEVNLSEVRPDGQEMYIQSGWLRASHRALGPSATELWPEHTFRKEDQVLLTPGEWVSARVGLASFGHAFRTGSRIRISVDTPGDSRAEWRFALKEFPGGAHYDVGANAAHASSMVLPVVPGVPVATPLPACPSLRGQQCRSYVPLDNEPAPP